MTSRPRRLAAAAALASAAFTLVACGGGGEEVAENEDGLVELTVMQITTMDAGPLHLGVEQGFFEEEGLDVTVQIAEAGSAIVPSVVNQESPIGYANVVSDLQAIDQGLDVQFVSNCCGTGSDPEADTSGIFVLPDSEIQAAADLEGANIAVNSVNNLGDLTIIRALEEQGVDGSTLEFTPMNYSDMPAALERGDVDAIWSVEPHRSISESHGFVNLSSNFVESFPDTQLGYYITSGAFAEANPEVVAGFQRAMDRANEYATDNPDEVRATIAETLDLDPELVAGANLATYVPGLDQDSVRAFGEAAVEQGMISEEPDYEEIFVEPQE
ncbi:ABC transporter substrate-binding protein [Georgenia sp. Z1491]|uniref:ABC transporter substrate-binding protein n=1 Tax=Georgenia sp. Z1491 TaxID=3416707 RepID=UPI003CEAC221